MSNIFDMEGRVAFREKSAWISLVVTLGVYGVYFFYCIRALEAGRPFGIGGPVTLAVVAIVVLQIVLNIAAAVLSPKDVRAPEDERERQIKQGADAGGFYVLQIGVMCAIVTVYFAERWSVANAALAALVFAQVIKYALVIRGYRRGF